MKQETIDLIEKAVQELKRETIDPIEKVIFDSLFKSFAEKLRELPEPPSGYFYAPGDIVDMKREGDQVFVDVKVELWPIMNEDNNTKTQD